MSLWVMQALWLGLALYIGIPFQWTAAFSIWCLIMLNAIHDRHILGMNLRLTKLESMDRLRDLTAKCLVQVLTTDESADRLKSSFDRIFARLEDKDLSLNESVCLVCELSVKRELKNAAKWLREALDLYNQQLESLGRYHKSLIGEMVGHNEMMRILTRQVELLNEKVDCFTQRAELLERDDEQQFEKISICV